MTLTDSSTFFFFNTFLRDKKKRNIFKVTYLDIIMDKNKTKNPVT